MNKKSEDAYAHLSWWKRFIRRHIIVTLLFLSVMYSFIGVFYYRYFTRARDESVEMVRLYYEFPDFGATFSGPSFYSISKGDDRIEFTNVYGSITVERIGSADIMGITDNAKTQVRKEVWDEHNGYKTYMRIIDEPRFLKGKKEYYITDGAASYLISTTAPGLFRDLDFIAESFELLQ